MSSNLGGTKRRSQNEYRKPHNCLVLGRLVAEEIVACEEKTRACMFLKRHGLRFVMLSRASWTLLNDEPSQQREKGRRLTCHELEKPPRKDDTVSLTKQPVDILCRNLCSLSFGLSIGRVVSCRASHVGRGIKSERPLGIRGGDEIRYKKKQWAILTKKVPDSFKYFLQSFPFPVPIQ